VIDGQPFADRELVRNAEIYLCGNPELVQKLKKFAYLNGASLSRIHADPFVVAPTRRRRVKKSASSSAPRGVIVPTG
jgi:ferredoxin-NADP reductase